MRRQLAILSPATVRTLVWVVLPALLLTFAAPRVALAQEATDRAPGAPALRVFVDCNRCDFDYLRREIPFVSYVRDRKDAELHILVTTQSTGGGGTEYVFKFIGLGRFEGVNDELKHVASQTETNDEHRAGYVQVLKLGLVRYVTSTTAADDLLVVYRPRDEGAAVPASQAPDPWNFWSFRVRGSGSLGGEATARSRNLFSSVSANRTTEAWKANFNASLNFRTNEFTLSDGQTLTDASHSHAVGGAVVKSLGGQWAAAARGGLAASTFLNQDRSVRLGGGLEYNVFPYAESSRRELTVQLSANLNHFDYVERTVYGKDAETVADAVLLGAFDVRQPWGSSGLSIEAATFFHDTGRHRLVASGEIDVRLLKGLSLTVDGSASRINDQLYLRAGGASDQEILLRRRQLATSYRYRVAVGISYTFGSIFNNVVNTRF